MTATQEDIDAVLEGIEGPEMKATVRRGGNFSIQYKALKDITAQYDGEGEETQSRDEVLMRHQLAVVDALKAAGLPARISNSRLVKHGDDEFWEATPCIWVNNTKRNATAAGTTKSTEALEKRINGLEESLGKVAGLLERLVSGDSPPL